MNLEDISEFAQDIWHLAKDGGYGNEDKRAILVTNRCIEFNSSHKKEVSQCFCENVDFQTYKHVVAMKAPFEVSWKTKDNTVPIDVCIATEIAELWHKGIETLNSCCGHNKSGSNVIVDKENLKKMKELGYTEYYLAPSGLPCVSLRTGTKQGTIELKENK
jgi:hypothetical protein